MSGPGDPKKPADGLDDEGDMGPAEPRTVSEPPGPPVSDALEQEQEQDLEREPTEAELDDVDIRELLRDALRPAPAPPPTLLRDVQRKLRARSRGKFYGDGWSTARSPRTTYLVTSVLMLLLIAIVLIALIPWGADPLP